MPQMLNVSKEIIDTFAVSPESRERIRAALDYDYAFITDAFNDNLIRAGRPFSVEQVYPIIARFGKCDYEIARILEEEFKKFVVLTLLTPGKPHAPSGAVDMYWHFFILHTEEYNDYCAKIWGDFRGDPKYRHHYPANDDTRPGMLRAYIETLELYRKVFGEPPVYSRPGAVSVAIWTNGSMTSGDSYSGIVLPDNIQILQEYEAAKKIE